MKILQAFDSFSLSHGGGTVDLVYKLSRALAQRGHGVAIYIEITLGRNGEKHVKNE